MVVNLYVAFKDPLFKTVNTLNSLIKDKTKIHDGNCLRLKTLDDYIEYFSSGEKNFEDDIQVKFAQSINKLLRLYLLRPVATNLPMKFRGVEHNEVTSGKLALGMYVDQFEQLVKTLNLDNLELYSKCLRYFLQPSFDDNLLLAFDRRHGNRHSSRQVRLSIEALQRMGVSP